MERHCEEAEFHQMLIAGSLAAEPPMPRPPAAADISFRYVRRSGMNPPAAFGDLRADSNSESADKSGSRCRLRPFQRSYSLRLFTAQECTVDEYSRPLDPAGFRLVRAAGIGVVESFRCRSPVAVLRVVNRWKATF